MKSLYLDADDILWVGMHDGGLGKFDSRTNKFTNFHKEPDASAPLQAEHVSSLLEDSKKRFWVGSDGVGAVIVR